LLTISNDGAKKRLHLVFAGVCLKGQFRQNKETTKMRTLSQIAREIRNDWKKVNYAAVPYLDAMQTLNSINEEYYFDSGRSVVAYFLANAGSWRGETARNVKAELKGML